MILLLFAIAIFTIIYILLICSDFYRIFVNSTQSCKHTVFILYYLSYRLPCINICDCMIVKQQQAIYMLYCIVRTRNMHYINVCKCVTQIKQ